MECDFLQCPLRSVLTNKGLAIEKTKQDFKKGAFYVSREQLAEFLKAVALPYNSPLTAEFTKVITRLFETGICSQNSKLMEMEANLERVSFEAMRADQARRRKLERRPVPLSMRNHCLGLFAVLGIGLTIASVAFTIERTTGK
jgi:hypothetical protein